MQCDHKLQITLESGRKRAEESNQQLQDHLQAIGVGIATGAILASTTSLITQPWYFPNGQKIELFTPSPHPFILASLISLLTALGAAYEMKIWLKKKRQRENQVLNKQQDSHTNS